MQDESVKLREKCDGLRKENAAMHIRLQNAEWSVAYLEQYSRMDNIEVLGVPQSRGENVYAVARVIGVPYDKRDISTAHRLPVPRDRRFHPSIVVRFALRSVRAEWLDAAKKKRNIQTTDMHASFNPGPVLLMNI
ncbi:hypothetical protein J6590_085748 [Homalodisca vitripennis]|nr:hypothetical protein J6590_085748 [Homalodisca vitripennis]